MFVTRWSNSKVYERKRFQQTLVLIKTSWRRLEGVFRLHLQKTSSRRLDYNQYIRLGHRSSSRRLQDVLKTSSRRLQDVFKTSSGRLRDVLKTSSRHLQDIFKTSSRHLQDVFKTFWRRLQDVLQRYLQDVFKTYHQVKLFLLTRLWEAFNTFLRRSFPKTIIYSGIYPGNTTSDQFMVSVQNLQKW